MNVFGSHGKKHFLSFKVILYPILIKGNRQVHYKNYILHFYLKYHFVNLNKIFNIYI
jgi:hypothetical protein